MFYRRTGGMRPWQPFYKRLPALRSAVGRPSPSLRCRGARCPREAARTQVGLRMILFESFSVSSCSRQFLVWEWHCSCTIGLSRVLIKTAYSNVALILFCCHSTTGSKFCCQWGHCKSRRTTAGWLHRLHSALQNVCHLFLFVKRGEKSLFVQCGYCC